MSDQEVLYDSVDGADSEGGDEYFAVAASAPTQCPPLPTLGLMGRMRRRLGEKQWAMLCRPGDIIFHFLCYRASHAFYKY